jgi:HK97 family phage major capsid protein
MGEINQLMSESVMLQADSQILSGDGSSPNFHSIDEYAGEFDPTSTLTGTVQAVAGTVPAPNIFDLCLCMAAQISSLGKKGGYQPNTVLMNDFDTYLNNFVKDKNDNYILPPFVQRTADGEYTIHNMLVRSNPLVPANTLYVFDRFKGKIFYRKGFVLEMAYNNGTDFEIDQVTVKGVMRMNFFVRNVDINAFMVCSDVAGAINQLKKV